MKTYIKPTTHVCYIDPDELLTMATQSKAFAAKTPATATVEKK